QGGQFKRGAPVNQPTIEFIDDAHPVMRGVVFNDVIINEASSLVLPASATVLVRSLRTPLVFAENDRGRRIVGLNFDPEQTNLPLRIGFPVLVYNAIEWLIQTPIQELDDPLSIPADGEVRMTTPDNQQRRLQPIAGQVHVEPSMPGFYQVTLGQGHAPKVLSVNVTSREETALSPL